MSFITSEILYGGVCYLDYFPRSHGQVPAASVKPDRPLMDLGFDSAGALRLRNKLARLGGCGDLVDSENGDFCSHFPCFFGS